MKKYELDSSILGVLAHEGPLCASSITRKVGERVNHNAEQPTHVSLSEVFLRLERLEDNDSVETHRGVEDELLFAITDDGQRRRIKLAKKQGRNAPETAGPVPAVS